MMKAYKRGVSRKWFIFLSIILVMAGLTILRTDHLVNVTIVVTGTVVDANTGAALDGARVLTSRSARMIQVPEWRAREIEEHHVHGADYSRYGGRSAFALTGIDGRFEATTVPTWSWTEYAWKKLLGIRDRLPHGFGVDSVYVGRLGYRGMVRSVRADEWRDESGRSGPRSVVVDLGTIRLSKE